MGGNPFLSILIMRGNPFLPTCPLKFYNSVLCWPFLPTCPLILFLIMGGEVFKRMEGNMRGHMIRWYDSADDSLVCTRWYVLHITTHRAYGSLVCTTRHIQVICLGGKVFKRMGGNMRGHMNGRKDEGAYEWFVGMIRWYDSLIWFVDMIRWYDSFIWFGIGFVGMYYKSRHTTGHMIRYRIRW